MIVELVQSKLRELTQRWAIPGWIMFIVGLISDVWWIAGHASTGQSVLRWLGFSKTLSISPAAETNHFWNPPGVVIANILLFAGLLWFSVLVVWPTLAAKRGSLLRRTRSLVKELTAFLNSNEGNVYAIHFDYDAKFRLRVDKTFSELAAQEIFDVVEGDWVINPQTQTAKNIRENVIARLNLLADRLEAKESAPRSKLVGEIESGKFTVRGESSSLGKVTPRVNVCVMLRVTNKEKIETTLKRANLKMTVGGDTYRGHKTTLWFPKDHPDLLQKITNTTPIRHGPATVGSLEFTVEGLRCPQHGLSADVSVILVDEFDLPHVIRNRELWIAA
jgi:hypothetical protein